MIKKVLLVLCALGLGVIASPVFACTWVWTNPTTNIDGTPATDLTATNLYFQAQGLFTFVLEGSAPAPANSVVVPGACKKGSYWVTAVNSLGIESATSNVVVVKQPNNPTSLTGSK